MSTVFEFFAYKQCPNCKYDWQRKYIRNNETKEIIVQYANVHKREEYNQINKKHYIIFRCLRCFKEFAESYDVITEDEFNQMNAINRDLSKIKPIVIENIDETKLLDDDAMMDLIGK